MKGFIGSQPKGFLQAIFCAVLAFALFLAIPTNEAEAACGGTIRTWDADNNNNRWEQDANWSDDDRPNSSTEDAVIVSAARPCRTRETVTIGCLEVQTGGRIICNNGTTLTITGDYFRMEDGTVTCPDTRTAVVDMAGTTAQTIDMQPSQVWNNLQISNQTTVTITNGMTVSDQLSFTAGSPTVTLIIDESATFTLSDATYTHTIPNGVTVRVEDGATFEVQGNLTVNGTLDIDPGGTVKIGNGSTLTVGTTGHLIVAGTSGKIATLTSTGAGDSFTADIQGQITLSFFRIERMDAAGLNINGTSGQIVSMGDGEFHNIANNGYAITLDANSSIPTDADNVGFFDDDGHGNTQSFNASAYNVSNINLDNWSGEVGGEGNDNDGNNRIDWGTEAGLTLTVSDSTAGGSPPSTISNNSAETYFATFAFALSKTGTDTNITAITFTNDGTASAGDISAVRVYEDAGGGTSCVYDSGTDTQLGTDLSMTGSPPEATLSGISVSTTGTTPVCFHVTVETTSSAADGGTLSMQIAGTADVTNDQAYSFSIGSSPPVSAGVSTIDGVADRIWTGDTSTAWSTGANWTPGTNGTSNARNCIIGSGSNDTVVDSANVNCANGDWNSGAVIDFNSTTNTVRLRGNLDVEAGVTFQNASTGNILMRSQDANQSLRMRTAFPGNLQIDNTGTAPNNKVTVDANSEIQGNVTWLNNPGRGQLSVASGFTLTVGGDITVKNGATLEIEPGGILEFTTDGSSITVESGGTLKIVGTSGNPAAMTSSSNSIGYNIEVQSGGTIEARHYQFTRLGTGGLTIRSGATINGTNFLQDGVFSYPVDSSMAFLTLEEPIPGDTLTDMAFNSNGSVATSVVNIDTSAIGSGGPLTVNGYSGDLADEPNDNDGVYAVSWTGGATTLTVTQNATGPASMGRGDTYNMGRWGFTQTDAGSFADTNLDSITIELTGTGSASDVDQVRMYYDSDCDGTGGTQRGGNQTFSGSPPTATFSGMTSTTVQGDVATPPTRCMYVEMDISASATDSATLGLQITDATGVTNSQGYSVIGVFPLGLGAAGTIVASSWSGAVDSDWFDDNNWDGDVPTADESCTIPNTGTDPVINGGSGTAICKDMTIESGATVTLTNATSAELQVFGNLVSTGTITTNDGKLVFKDDGLLASDQTYRFSGQVDNVEIDKAAGGTLTQSTALIDIGTLTFASGNAGVLTMNSGATIRVDNDITLDNGGITINGGAQLQLAASTTLTVAGGTFKIAGTDDAFDQDMSTKGQLTRQGGSGTISFNSTSGTIDLEGFHIRYLDDNGFRIGGTTTLSQLDGGQFTELSANYGSMQAIQINTTGTIPATADNVGFNWDAANTLNAASCCAPAPATTYLLASSTGCNSQTISFTNWFGDFFQNVSLPDPQTKVSDTNCTITISVANSPVTLMTFSATPFDGQAAVHWTTGSEENHIGFNIYRSENFNTGFVQVNSSMIRNGFQGGGVHANYRFVDTGLENGKTYYYRLEDVAANGARKFHGPVSVTPQAGLGNPPAADPGTNDYTSDGAATDPGDPADPTHPGSGLSPIASPGYRDLGNGVRILTQTSNSLRIEVVPPDLTSVDGAPDASYKRISIPGYSHTVDEGKPELLERTILIELEDDAGTVQVSTVVEETEDTPQTIKIEPAPTAGVDGSNNLTLTHAVDAAAYAENTLAPTDYYTLNTTVREIGSKKYLELKVNPVKYNPVSQELRLLDKLVLDIGIDGAAWADPPLAAEYLPPGAYPGALRIRFTESGMYRVTYNEIAAFGLEGPFASRDVNDFRLYFRGEEIPIKIDSGTGFFDTGDSFIFYVDHYRKKDHRENEVVLTTFDVDGGAPAPLRFGTVDGDPTGVPETSDPLTFRRVRLEESYFEMFDRPMGADNDHVFWQRTFRQSGGGAIGPSFFNVNAALPGLSQVSGVNVRVKVYMAGRHSTDVVNPLHHVSLLVGGSIVDSVQWMGNEEQSFDLFVTPSLLAPGNNTLTFENIADGVPAGDFGIVDFNRVEVEYLSEMIAVDDEAHIFNTDIGAAFTTFGFSSANITAYDVSETGITTEVLNPQITTDDGGASYDITIASNEGASGDEGYRYFIMEDSNLRQATSFALSHGESTPLKSTSNQADMIIIGTSELLNAVEALTAKREGDGLDVREVRLDQIYAEFGDGLESGKSIRDFLTYAYNNWQAPKPAYVLMLGDATYDPKHDVGDDYGYVKDPNTTPILLTNGIFADFGTDNRFVAPDDATQLPNMAIGRLPSSDPNVIEAYVTKLLDYEAGTTAPAGEKGRHTIFITGPDIENENFKNQSEELASVLTQAAWPFTADSLDRADMASDAALNTALVDAVNEGAFLVNYMGHGAEDRWGTPTIMSNAIASSMTNTTLPIVMALNCYNARFYDPDVDMVTLAEQMIFNENGGAIAFWGSTADTNPAVQLALGKAFLNELSNDTSQPFTPIRLGDLMLRAKYAVPNNAATQDAISSWSLIGDPAMMLPPDAFDHAPVSQNFTGPSSGGGDDGGSCGTIVDVNAGGGPPSATTIINFFLALILALAMSLSMRMRRVQIRLGSRK